MITNIKLIIYNYFSFYNLIEINNKLTNIMQKIKYFLILLFANF
jgi:hypothetical protein